MAISGTGRISQSRSGDTLYSNRNGNTTEPRSGGTNALKLVIIFKKILFIIFNFKLLKKLQILFSKRFFSMMLFWVHHIFGDRVNLRVPIGKTTIPNLPSKFPA